VAQSERWHDLELIRAIADTICRKALADNGYRDQLKANPSSVLKRDGIPEALTEDLSRELIIDSIRLLDNGDCARTCFITCFFTAI
jgi:hypothetical protein